MKILSASRLDKIKNTAIRKSVVLEHHENEHPENAYITLNGLVQGNRQRGRPVKMKPDGIRDDVKKLNLIIRSK